MRAAPNKGATRTLWRAFHWDAEAAEGDPFSVRSVPPLEQQISGRFDNGATSVLYLGESQTHAIAEVLREFRGRPVKPAHLRKHDFPLALVDVSAPGHVMAEIADLCDPNVLLHYGIRADVLALPESERAATQPVSRKIYEAGAPGFRWWSAIHGGWHSTVLFINRVPLERLSFGSPVVIGVEHPAVIAGARELRML